MIWSDSVPTLLTILGLVNVATLIATAAHQASRKFWGDALALVVLAGIVTVLPTAIDHAQFIASSVAGSHP